MRKIAGKMPRPRTTAQTLCEPARLKRMSRFHKSHFMRNYAEIYRKNAAAQSEHPDQAPALTLTGLP